MKCEIIAVGSELTCGKTINTNAAFLGAEFQKLGLESNFHTTVDDNTERIHEVLKQALNRAEIIITTGGLGPTHDDLTHEAIAGFFRTKLQKDKKVLKKIKRKFDLKQKKMPKINIKQAYKPKNAKWIPNKLGTANGIIWKINFQGKKIYILTFPGVPRELISMWNETGKHFIEKISGKSCIYSKVLKFTGIGESALAEKLKGFFKLKDPVVAPYASIGEVKIVITAKETSKQNAVQAANKIAKSILKKTKDFHFGTDNETLEGLAGKKLLLKKKTIALAESCTGGLLSKRLTDMPGSSKYLRFSIVSYSNESKIKLLNVKKETLKEYGAVSPQIAYEMARGVQRLGNSDIGFSITGIAGPNGGSKLKPVGLVYFGLALKNKVKIQKMFWGQDSTRDEIRFLSTQFALNWLRKNL